jgi:hypothetical protein
MNLATKIISIIAGVLYVGFCLIAIESIYALSFVINIWSFPDVLLTRLPAISLSTLLAVLSFLNMKQRIWMSERKHWGATRRLIYAIILLILLPLVVFFFMIYWLIISCNSGLQPC